MGKGVIFSTDAVLAAAISTMLVFFIFATIDSVQRAAADELSLSRASHDLLRSMEKSGALYNVTTKDAEIAKMEMTNFTGALPYSFCIYNLQFRNYPSGNVTARLARIRGCQCTERIVVTKRDYVYYNSTAASFDRFVVQLETCYAERQG